VSGRKQKKETNVPSKVRRRERRGVLSASPWGPVNEIKSKKCKRKGGQNGTAIRRLVGNKTAWFWKKKGSESS